MADISSINLNGNSYNIKDNNAVSKSGDTMTGNLTLQNGRMLFLESSVSTGLQSASIYLRQDGVSHGNNVSIWYNDTNSHGAQLYQLPAYDETLSSANYYYKILTSKEPVAIEEGGTGATTAADARTNLNAVNKSGDIISGTVTFYQPGNSYTDSILCVGRISKTYIGNLNNSSGYTRTGITQENGNGNKEYFRLPISYSTENNNTYNILTSKNTVTVAQGGTGVATLTSGAALIGNGTNNITTRSITNNTSKNYITANTNLITANTLGYWNGAYNSSGSSNISYLGTISKGTWQGSAIDLNYGGTGGTDSGWQPYTDSDKFTGTIYYRKVGVFFMIMAQQINLKNTLAAGSYVLLMTVPSTYRPSKEVMPSCFINTGLVQDRVAPMRLVYNGQLYLYANKTDAIDSSYNLYFSGFGM